MNFKRSIAVVLAAASVITVAGTGCKKEETAENGKMKITWMGVPYYAGAEEGGYAEKLLEEKFNIEIEPIFLDSEGYSNKKPIMMSQGNIPDVIYELDPKDVKADAEQGFLAEVPYETILKYAPSVANEVNTTAKEAWLYSYYDDKNYGVPNMYYSGKWGITGKWRKDWLDKLGITKVPETIEEYGDALYKITHNDPDGNGKNDTYGLTGDIKNYHYCFSEIFGAYGVLPFNWMEVDGKYVYGGTLPETKEALATLAKWYSEGLISPDFVTDSTDETIMEKFLNSKIGYMNSGSSVADSQLKILRAISPEADTVPAKLPTGPAGKSGSFAWGQGGHVIAFGRQLKDNPEKLQKILEILEYMYNDQEFAAKLTMGEEGVHYEKAPEDVGGMVKIPPYDKIEQSAKEFACFNHGSTSFFCIIPIKMETREKFDTNKTLENRRNINESNPALYDAFLKPDVVPESDKYFEDLRTKQLVYFAKIIRGEETVDYYDKFIEEWNKNGGAILEENANSIGEIRDNIYAQVNAK